MRGLLAVSLSVGAHVAIAALLLAPKHANRDDAPAPPLAGETFELPAPAMVEVAAAVNAAPPPEPETVGSVAGEGEASARPPAASRGRPARPSARARSSPSHAAAGSSAEASGESTTPALYGAVGERSATDLATAFTRGFPQAASADPAWRAAPLGSAGDADVVLMLDEHGLIEAMQILGAPSPALTSAIHRTFALVKGRPFVAKARTTKLHLHAVVSADAVHDGLHGDVFAIGGSFAGGEGSAFFALAIGRRIDVRVRVK